MEATTVKRRRAASPIAKAWDDLEEELALQEKEQHEMAEIL